jgi:hypothetical protein
MMRQYFHGRNIDPAFSQSFLDVVGTSTLENAVIHLDTMGLIPRRVSLLFPSRFSFPERRIKRRGGYADNPSGFRALLSLCLLFSSFSFLLLFRLVFISSPFAIAFVTETVAEKRQE